MRIKSYKKDGKVVYKFNVYLGKDPLTGKEKRTRRQGFKTKKDAEIAYLRLKTNADKKQKEHKRVTFKEVYDLWLAQYSLGVRSTTLKKKIAQFEHHILPTFGHVYLDKIDYMFCQNFVNEHAIKFVWNNFLKGNVSCVLKHAIKLGLIDKNPTLNVDMPKIKKTHKKRTDNFWDKPTLLIFLQKSKKDLSTKWYTFFYLLAFTGLRRGEALGLHWSDIDFKAKTLSVNRNLGEGRVITKPKTKKSERVISIDDNLIGVLKKWRIEQIPSLNNDIVFTSDKKREYICLSTPRDYLKKVVYNRNLPWLTVHGFRHTHCSLLFEAGASIKEVQDRLGHANISTTMDIYAHVTKGRKKEVADKFGKFLYG